jgi:protein-tyrosine phosphatase
VHCGGGLGRTGLVTACCLVAKGFSPLSAIRAVRLTRPRAFETEAQERYVYAYAEPPVIPRLPPRPRGV